MNDEFGFPKIEKPNVGYMKFPDSIMIRVDGASISIAKDDERYAKIENAINLNQLDSIPAMLDDSKRFDNIGLRLENGVLYTKESNQPLPSELSERIIDFSKANEPVDTLLNFWDNLKKNESFNSRKMLFKFLEHNGHPITTDGCFIAYRSVRSDFKDHHTGTMDNSVGKIVEINRSEVDDNPNNTCSNGLHVATWDYASTFGSNRVMVEVKVHPQDVVCVPTDYNGTKMRVSRFEVLSVCEAPRMNEAVYRPASLEMSFDASDDELEEYEEDEDNFYDDEEEDDDSF